MPTKPSLCLLLIALALPATADEVDDFIAEKRKHYHCLSAKSFHVKLTLTNHEHTDLEHKGKPWAVLRHVNMWKQDLDMTGLPKEWHKTHKDLLNFWLSQDWTQGGALGVMMSLKERSMEPGKKKTGVIGAHPFLGPVRVTYRNKDHALESLDLLKAGFRIAYHLERVGEKWRIESREIWVKKNLWTTTFHGGLKKVGGRLLPTRVTVELGAQVEYKWALGPWTIDDQKVAVVPMDEDEAKSVLDNFEKNWRRWDDKERARRIRMLPELNHARVVTTLAKMLKDKGCSKAVRQAGAVTMGELGVHGKDAVKPLLAALDWKQNQLDKEVYFGICESLGKIGHPDAIKRLGKPVIQDRVGWEGYWARARALGEIRDKKAIDALMKMLVAIDRWRYAHVWKLMVDPLKKATGQDFGHERARWRKWWRENRDGFTFPGEKPLK